MNNLRKERDVLILVLLVFNIIELIGAIIVKGDWGYMVFANVVFLTLFLLLKQEKKKVKKKWNKYI